MRLTTDENATELTRAETLQVRDLMHGVIRAQMATSLTGAEGLLKAALGEEKYARLLLDLANNLTQAFC